MYCRTSILCVKEEVDNHDAADRIEDDENEEFVEGRLAGLDGQHQSFQHLMLQQMMEWNGISTNKAGPKATQVKERAFYDLTRTYCTNKEVSDIL
jgi:hypothetical protein